MALDNDSGTPNAEVGAPNNTIDLSISSVETTPEVTSVLEDDNTQHAQDDEYKPASCFQQTYALVCKNLLNKIRTPLSTILELFSPFIFMWILVYGYQQSDEEIKSAKSYSNWEIFLPNEALNGIVLQYLEENIPLASVILDGRRLSDDAENRLLEQDEFTTTTTGFVPLALQQHENLEVAFDHQVEGNFEANDDSRERRLGNNVFETGQTYWKDIEQMSRFLQSDNNSNSTDNDNDNKNTGYQSVVNGYNELRKEINRLLEGPFPIPTITQFLTLSQTLSESFDPSELDLVFQNTDYMRKWGNLLTLGTMHISPRGSITDEFIDFLTDVHGIYNISNSDANGTSPEDRPNATSLLIRVHENKDDALAYTLDNLDERTFAAIHFDDQDDDEGFQYTLRMNSTTLPNTNEITDLVSIGLNTGYQRYFFSGYLTLQRTINEFAIQRISEETTSNTGQCESPDTSGMNIMTMPMPTPAYAQNPFFTSVGFLLGLVIAMAFLYPVSRQIKSIVEEKETRMKETLLILGVGPWAQWFSWTITASLTAFIVTCTVAFTLSIFVMKHSSKTYIFIYILFFASATSGFSFFVASFFSRANLASIVGPVALFATLLPKWIFFGSNQYEAAAAKKWASLLPCTAFAFGADILSDYEYAQIGVQRFNVNDGTYSFNTSLGFLFFDSILYTVLGWYLEQVIPRQYGVAREWYFLFLPSYWAGVCPFLKKREYLRDTNSAEVYPTKSNDLETGFIENVIGVASVRISNLVKIYDPKKPPAVNNLDLSMYDSEITCLLGHNGAGKSSTISILSGLYPPTRGDCIIYGKSIVRDLEHCRQSMGICPQHNVLFDNLTVLEHLRFFHRIKGVSTESSTDSAVEIGLGDFLHTKAGQLSGGNKRKLQLAIALAGQPKLVLLDEPTSGMDPYSRRATWELLRRKRQGKVLLLTTHFMDEAEVLADRVAILKDGTLQCCGSPLFLKQRFGLGYNITLVTDEKIESQQIETDDKGISSENNQGSRSEIHAFLSRFVPDTRFIRESAKEVVFRFPPKSEEKFPILFDEIEATSKNIGIKSYGISNTSLEEVFLELAEGDNTDETDTSTQNITINELHTEETEYQYMSAVSQVLLLLHKRLLIQRRDLKGLFFKILLPVILICLVLLVLIIEVPTRSKPIELDANLFQKSGSGSSVKHEIFVGGRQKGDFQNFPDIVTNAHPSATVTEFDISTSGELSSMIAEEHIKGLRDTSYGSFVFGDTIAMILNVSWSSIDVSLGDINLDGLQDINSTEFIDAINQTLTDLNVTVDDDVLSSLNETLFDIILSPNLNSSVINDLINQTEELLNITIPDDAIEDLNGTLLDLDISSLLSDIANNETAIYTAQIDVPISIMHNASSTHSLAAYIQSYYDYLYKDCAGSRKIKLSATNQPLPLTSKQSTEIKTILSIIASILLSIPFNYIPAAFAVFVVKERSCKSKHLQLVSGVDMSSYWLSTYLWDMFLYLILIAIAMLGFFSFGEASAVFTGTASTSLCTWICMVGYGLSSLPFAYLLSRLFENPPNAQISIMIITFITGFVAVNAYYILNALEKTKDLAQSLRIVFRIWPAYNLGDAFIELASNFWYSQVRNMGKDPFSWDVCGEHIAYLFGLAPVYIIWLMILEYSSDGGSGGLFGQFSRWLSLQLHMLHLKLSETKLTLTAEEERDMDEDVRQLEEEIDRSLPTMVQSSPVLISNLWKVYKKNSFFMSLIHRLMHCLCKKGHHPQKIAVKKISANVESGETLGLLGVNGAGKTTTMGILTGDFAPTSGGAYVAGYDVTGNTRNGVSSARKKTGFCPQADPLLDLMTGRETLNMFGRLRGIPEHILDDEVEDLLKSLTLTPHADKVSETYSGGNKRKLSLGIALIGNPKVLFIDESSSGMDPGARRKIWDLIAAIASKDRALVLTTHSMEEAEALCGKVAIMINGQIRCVGGVQHLKNKFLGGYTVDVSCSIDSTEESIVAIEQYILHNVLNHKSKVSERHGRFIKFEVLNIDDDDDDEEQEKESGDGRKRSLGSLFSQFQSMVDDVNSALESYSISQCTLEQVFINLVHSESMKNNISENEERNADHL